MSLRRLFVSFTWAMLGRLDGLVASIGILGLPLRQENLMRTKTADDEKMVLFV